MDYPKADRYGRPIMPHPETGVEQSWTRATTIAKCLDDGNGLISWTGAMVAGGAYLRPDLVCQVGARWPMTDDNKGEIYSIIGDLKDAGIIDPLKVTRAAFQNALSVAANYLTIGAAVTNVPEKKGPAGIPGGMPGMGGEDY